MKKLVVLSLAAMILLALPALALRKVDVKTATLKDMPDAQGTAIQRIGSPKTVGTAVGTTTVDWPSNGNILGNIAIDNDGGVHLGWTYRDDAGTAASRRMMYNYRGTNGAYLGATAFSDIPGNRWGSINCSHDGIGRGFYYATDDAGNYPPLYSYDAGPGLGVFTTDGIDSAEANASPWFGLAWIRNAKVINSGNSDTIYAMGQGDVDQPVFISSYDGGITWNDWTDLQDGGVFLPAFPEQQMVAGAGGKVAISLVDANNQQVYRESNDYGVSWGATTVAIDPLTSCPLGDTLLPYIHTSVFYDNNNDLHISNAYYSYNINHTGDSTLLYVGVLDWTAANGVRYVTHDLTSNVQWGATNNLNWSYPNLCQKAGGFMIMTMVHFDSTDIAANGYANGEVFYATSANGGLDWGTPVNITNSPTPGAAAGACEDDSYADCAVLGDTLHVTWLLSYDAGQALQGYGAMTVDDQYHCALYVPDGVAGNPPTQPTYGFALNQSRPNPVTRNAEISFNLPKAGDYSLRVFNVAGQAVKEFRGQGKAGANSISWNAKDAPAGIYFYKLTSGGNAATRKLVVVK